MKRVISLCIFVFVVLATANTNYQHGDYDEIPPNPEKLDPQGLRIVYDFIVVGAGASGNLVAARYIYTTEYKRVYIKEIHFMGTNFFFVGWLMRQT
jgi:hypothetical protein